MHLKRMKTEHLIAQDVKEIVTQVSAGIVAWKMKTRYVRQRDNTSCGPVALINILKWQGLDVCYDEYIHFMRHLCDHTPGADGGTTEIGMRRALKSLGIKFKVYRMNKLYKMDKHLDAGNIALLDYPVPYYCKGGKIDFCKGDLHFALCIGRTPKTYTMVNDGTRNTVGHRLRSTMEKMFRESDTHVWLINSCGRHCR